MASSGQCAILFLVISVGAATELTHTTVANPVRRVVTMLEMMGKQIAEEGVKEEKMYDRYMCFCKDGGGKLETSISDAQNKIPQLESSIEETGSEIIQLKADVKQHKADQAGAKTAMAEATALRKKEGAEFASYHSEASVNIKAMQGAIAALEKGGSGAFLQTPAAAHLKRALSAVDLADDDREVVTAFFSEEPNSMQGGQIVGILKQMEDTWTSDLEKATEAENSSKADYDGLMKAKGKEVAVLQKMTESKSERIGEEGVAVVQLAEDLEDTKTGLAEDQKFLSGLAKNCDAKKAEWTERQKLRSEEQLAISETVKILNDDDALELFKQTLPSPAFLQLKTVSREVRRQSIEVLRNIGDTRIDLISLALRGKKVSFDKVLAMIDSMVALLADEQKADEDKKKYCEKEFDAAEDQQKALEKTISDLAKAIADAKVTSASSTDEINVLEKRIMDLDKMVAEATAERKEAHAEFVEELAANKAAGELLSIAANRLNKFYNSALYKAPPKRDLSEEERITVNMGGTLAPTMASGIAGTGVTAFSQTGEKPGPAPEMYGGYQKKGEESTGVVAMIDVLKADLAKQIQESEVEEKHDQDEYEQMMTDSAEKRATDGKSLEGKVAAKADAQARLVSLNQNHEAKEGEAMANAHYIHSLHQDCDWLISSFDVRTAARSGEVESLTTAKAVLSGADYSLLQSSRAVKRH